MNCVIMEKEVTGQYAVRTPPEETHQIQRNRMMLVENGTLIARRDTNSFNVTLILLGVALVVWTVTMAGRDALLIQQSTLLNFSTIFISIVLEAFPFVLFGVFISSLIQIFVTEDMLIRWIPRGKAPALLAASMMGIFFPICECANVPVTRRLIAKGVPLHVGITFLMSVAIMNPVVLISTYYAFGGQWRIALFRGILGMLSAIIIGYAVSLMKNPDKMLRHHEDESGCGCGHDHDHDHHSHDHTPNCHDHSSSHDESCCEDLSHHHEHHEPTQAENLHTHDQPLSCGCGCHAELAQPARRRFENETLHRVFSRMGDIIRHTSIELYSVGRFLIMGAFISSFVQTFLPRGLLLSIGQRPIVSVLILMALAYGLSLCSEADAFIARTFVGQFTTGSIVAFMIYGPMIDVKNTLMLLDGFQTRFVGRLIAITTVVCLCFALLINLVGW